MGTCGSEDEGSAALSVEQPGGRIEMQLRLCLDGLIDACFFLDSEWRFKNINDRALECFGRSREEMTGRCIWELYPQTTGSRMWNEYHRAVAENVPVHFEMKADFCERFFEVYAYPERGGLKVYLRDITAQKQAEEALRENERRYQGLIKNAPAAIYEIDFRKNKFTTVNDAMCLMSGYSREELLAMNPLDIMSRQSRITFKKRLEQWFNGEEPDHNVDYIVTRKDGREACVALNVSFMRDENGAPLGATAVAQDITERKQAEEKIKRQNTILQAINKAYEQYVLCDTLEELGKACLGILENITGSAISFVGETGGDGFFYDTAISATGWEQCDMYDKQGHKRQTGCFTIRGLYGSVLSSGRTLMTNAPASHPERAGVPQGHIAITAFLGVPFIQHGNVSGMVGVANREDGYTENEKEILEAVAPTVCEVLLRKRAEEALRESEGKLRAVIESTNNIIFLKDTQSRIIMANNALEILVGKHKSEFLGKDDHALYADAEIAETIINDDHIVLSSGEPRYFEEVVESTQGMKTYLASKVPYRDPEGRIIGIVGMAQDITERKSMEEALRENEERTRSLLEELAKADRNKNEFLNALSHELRNPLAAISAGLQLLDITNDEKQAKTAKEIMNRQMDQLCRLVDELLDLTRITNNKITLKKECVDINRLVQLSANDHRPLFDRKRLKLNVTPCSEKLFAEADPVRVKQITGNLLHNAYKFSNEGGEVTLSAYEQEGYAVICVRDSGVGISHDDLPKLFMPFAQINNNIERANGGLGLGLSIVKGIARLHGGDAEATSEGEGRGASFFIKLPLDKNMNERQPADAGPAVNAGKLRVLFIEDNKDYSEMFCTMLGILGHEAAAASDGNEGIKKAREYLPDVIICDIGLPGMNGYEVAKALRRDKNVKRAFMAALSGYARPQDVEAALAAGFDRHIAKPVSMETLKQMLGAVQK